MKKIIGIIILSFFSFALLGQYIQYGNGNNPPADFAAHPDDLAGLQALYNALDGPNWTVPNHVRWKMTPLSQDGLTPFLYHIWYMVHFKPNHRVGKIIFFGSEGLSGSIPPEISKLTELEVLIITNSNITDISNIKNLPNLQILEIVGCNLTGEIPCLTDYLPKLGGLSLIQNALSGPLPECLTGPNSALKHLSVRDNNLSGCIPESYNRFCNSYQVSYHYDNNAFENTIQDICNNIPCDDCPNEYPILWDFYQSTGGPNWTNITSNTVTVGAVNVPEMLVWWEQLYYQYGFTNWVDISSIIEFEPILTDIDFPHLINYYQNNPSLVVAGTTSVVSDAWFEDCDPCGIDDGSPWKGITCNGNREITHINLHSSNLVGSLPASLSGLTSLQLLNLGDNAISGSIPADYASLINLQILNISSNSLSGQFPTYIKDFNYLQYLHLGNNDLTGSLPQDFSKLIYLKEFRVNDNQLSGGLNNSLGNCAQLIHFDASSNQLENDLPPSLGALPDLTHIYLDENKFVGEVPGQWGDLQSIVRIDVRQNLLTGTLLNNNLEKLCPINTITNYHINDGNNIDEMWSMMCHCVSTDYPTFSMYPAAIPGLADPNTPCCQIFTDDVITDGDGNIYTAYRIGNQVWLQENLMTRSCLDGTPLPKYRSTSNSLDISPTVFYGDSSCDIPLVASVSNLTNGYSLGDIIPYGLHYSQYLFSQNNSNTITGNYSQYSDGSVCQVCPQGYKIATGQDFQILKQFLNGKDIHDVNETCIKPIGGGFIDDLPQQLPGGNQPYYFAPSMGQGTDYLWTSSNASSPFGVQLVQPYDIHFSSNGSIETDSYGNQGLHLQPRANYRSIRCIKE